MNDRFQLLAAINGVAIKCIIALIWEQRQLTISELESRIGHDKNTVRKALVQLELYGLAGQVISSREMWHLTDKGYQLPLPLHALAPPGGEDSAESTSSGKNFTIGPRLAQCSEESPIDAEVSANLVALHRVGIVGRKAVSLARLEWVTPEYITAMHARWQAEGYIARDTGLLVRYIEDGDPAPVICEECGGVGGHYAECQSFGDLALLAELVATGQVESISKPSPALVQAMLRYNQEQIEISY